jgi:uncharacterized protein (DUF1810 family)
MGDANRPDGAGDPHDLTRFVWAQADDYERALSEIKSSEKRSHWMWYVFPQFDGLGSSPTARRYAIKSLAEAKAYLAHPLLGPRLLECAEAVRRIAGRSASDIFGSPDDMKLRSCATLFAHVSRAGSVFDRLLAKFFQGVRADRTLQLLALAAKESSEKAPLDSMGPPVPVAGSTADSAGGTSGLFCRLWERLSRLWRSLPCDICGAPSVGFIATVTGRGPTQDVAGKPLTKLDAGQVRRACRKCLREVVL